jgi:hypothetical protein
MAHKMVVAEAEVVLVLLERLVHLQAQILV